MIEKILKFSIQHRYLVVLLVAIAAGYGFYQLKHLPIDAVPDITNNQVQINIVAEGLSPQEVEQQITFPIENALSGIPGLESTRSLSRNGFSQVTAIFDDKVNVYFARQQIDERLSEVKEQLPKGSDPKMGPISTGLGEIYMWTVEYEHPEGRGAPVHEGKSGWQADGSYLTPEGTHLRSEIELASYLRTVQDWMIRPQLRGTPGLAEVDSIGGYVRQYHVEPDMRKMQAAGITFQELIHALENNNLSVGGGYIEYGKESYMVKADGRIESADQLGSIVLKTSKGRPVYVKDIASIGIGKELRTGSATENGKEVVIGTAMMLIGANSRTVSKAVDEKMAVINLSLPPDIRARTVLNRTKLVDATISTVVKNLTEGALLVISVLFLMLGNFRAALITAFIIPLSMLLTAIGMVGSKVSGNLMSLGALDFGLLVDGAIIITENCLRHLQEKREQLGRPLALQERLDEVMVSAKEMIQPTVYGQIIILTVYLPLLTFSGVEGKMFEPMAVTVIFALLAAFALSLTFTPAMIAILVNNLKQEKESRYFHYLQDWYAAALKKTLEIPKQAAAAGAIFFAASIFIFTHLGQEFIPQLDEKDIALHAIRIPSTSLTQSTAMQREVEKLLAAFPEVSLVFSKTGTAEMASDPMPPNVSDTFVMLKPQEEWPDPTLSKLALIEKIEERLQELPGNNYEFTQPIEMRFNELIAGVRSDVAIKIYGDNFDQMQKSAQTIANLIGSIPGASDVKVSQTDGLPTLEVKVKKEAAKRIGASLSDILDTIAIATGGGKAGVIREGDRKFDVVVRLPQEKREDPDALSMLPIPLSNGGHIPLKELASLEKSEGMNEINRENGKRMVVVEANVRGSDLGSFVNKSKEVLANHFPIPPGYWLEWGGQFQNLLSARAHLSLIVPLCFFLIFLMLFKALHSAIDALIVFSGIPLALTGGILAIWFRDIPFSISAAVGFIALSGIAVLNGLVLITSIKHLLEKGFQPDEAIANGATSRLRPVLMTALVASLGFIPMALASGTGAEVQKPLATVVIGGLISSTLLTLFVLPCLYKLRWSDTPRTG